MFMYSEFSSSNRAGALMSAQLQMYACVLKSVSALMWSGNWLGWCCTELDNLLVIMAGKSKNLKAFFEPQIWKKNRHSRSNVF